MAELRDAERTASAELARLGPVEPPVDPVEAANAVEALLGYWPQMLPAERGQALRALLVDTVVVRPASRWREPESDRVDVRFRW